MLSTGWLGGSNCLGTRYICKGSFGGAVCAPRNGELADVVEDIESEHLHRIKMFSAKTPAPEGLLQHNTYTKRYNKYVQDMF